MIDLQRLLCVNWNGRICVLKLLSAFCLNEAVAALGPPI